MNGETKRKLINESKSIMYFMPDGMRIITKNQALNLLSFNGKDLSVTDDNRTVMLSIEKEKENDDQRRIQNIQKNNKKRNCKRDTI